VSHYSWASWPVYNLTQTIPRRCPVLSGVDRSGVRSVRRMSNRRMPFRLQLPFRRISVRECCHFAIARGYAAYNCRWLIILRRWTIAVHVTDHRLFSSCTQVVISLNLRPSAFRQKRPTGESPNIPLSVVEKTSVVGLQLAWLYFCTSSMSNVQCCSVCISILSLN